MKNKKVVFFALFSCLFLFFSCSQKKAGSTAKVPDWVNKFIPAENTIYGIGMAKTESDGEAILLAEDRARMEIARQISVNIKNTLTENKDTAITTDFTELRTNVNFSGSKVIYREKDRNGTWWCLVSLLRNQAIDSHIEPLNDNVSDILRINAAELSDMDLREDIIRNVDISKLEWVFNPSKYQMEDMLFGLGAAKLDNDKESVQLAKDRARRSLARSLQTEVKEVFYDLNDTDGSGEFIFSYQEEDSFIESVYDHSFIKTELVHIAKTKDGTWWVLLGCTNKANGR